MCPDKTNKILVFDIEGTDSKERGEQRLVSAFQKYNYLFVQTFEQTISLFALSVADVLMINMWT